MIWEEDPGVSSPWLRFPLPRKPCSFCTVKGDLGLWRLEWSGAACFPFEAWLQFTQAHPNERAGAVVGSVRLQPAHPLWSSCPFSTWPVLSPYLGCPGSRCRKWAWAWLPVVGGPPPVTSQGRPVGYGICTPHPSPSMGATLWGLRAISGLHRRGRPVPRPEGTAAHIRSVV